MADDLKFDFEASKRVRDLLRSMMEHGGWQILENYMKGQINAGIDLGMTMKSTPTEMAHTAGRISAFRDLTKWVKMQHDALDAQIKQHIKQHGGTDNVAQ